MPSSLSHGTVYAEMSAESATPINPSETVSAAAPSERAPFFAAWRADAAAAEAAAAEALALVLTLEALAADEPEVVTAPDAAAAVADDDSGAAEVRGTLWLPVPMLIVAAGVPFRAAFWYHGSSKRSGMQLRRGAARVSFENFGLAARRVFTYRASQPCSARPGYVLMKPETVNSPVSCSRPIGPGDLPPTIHPVSSASRPPSVPGPYEGQLLRGGSKSIISSRARTVKVPTELTPVRH